MLHEAMEFLRPQPGHIVVDATLGAGGYSMAILERLERKGMVIGIDRDRLAVEAASARLADWGQVFSARKAAFSELPEVLAEFGIERVDGLVADLGVSTMQLGSADRGFSFSIEGRLDMRMDLEQERTAADVVNTESEKELARILWEYGEERFARRIAREIVAERRRNPFRTTRELAELVERVLPPRRQRIAPATRSFQAIRIATNDELGQLRALCEHAPRILKPGGVFACVCFHSLEDRIVKTCLRQREVWQSLTRKPLTPTEEEVGRNPRSRSAKLRAAMRK
jgi:16S rRNA (cytosine1402-N4)-methyltransferase